MVSNIDDENLVLEHAVEYDEPDEEVSDAKSIADIISKSKNSDHLYKQLKEAGLSGSEASELVDAVYGEQRAAPTIELSDEEGFEREPTDEELWGPDKSDFEGYDVPDENDMVSPEANVARKLLAGDKFKDNESLIKLTELDNYEPILRERKLTNVIMSLEPDVYEALIERLKSDPDVFSDERLKVLSDMRMKVVYHPKHMINAIMGVGGRR